MVTSSPPEMLRYSLLPGTTAWGVLDGATAVMMPEVRANEVVAKSLRSMVDDRWKSEVAASSWLVLSAPRPCM